MSAGKRRSRIDIQRPISGTDDWGHPIEAWETVIPGIWAQIRNLNGKNFISSGREVSENAVSIRVGYRSGILPEMRVLHGNVVYRIRAVLPDEERRRKVDLVCSLGAWDG